MAKKYYPNLHYWLIIPFLMILLGFQNYWMNFRSAPFHHHVHSIPATVWFVFLIVQPWIYHNRSIKLHRKVGMVGLFVAGMVAASALLVMKANLQVVSGPFLVMNYSLTLVNLLLIPGFTISVIMAIIKAKHTPSHTRWMISTIFWISGAATFRLSMMIQEWIGPSNPIEIEYVLAGNFIFIALFVFFLIILDYLKEKKVYSAYIIVMIANVISAPILIYMNDKEWVISFLTSMLS
jgi:hypothetical protein